MTWSRLDDTLYDHPKALAAGLEAMGLWCLTLSYCGRQNTDGHIPREVAQRLAGSSKVLARASKRLLESRLWEPAEDGGWRVHDFLHYNLSRDEVREKREKQREGGRAGAANRWRKTDGSSHGSTHGSTYAEPMTNRHAPVPTRPDPDPGERERRARAHANGEGRSGERYIRLGDPLTDDLRAIAQQANVQDIDGAWSKFTGHFADKWVHAQGKWQHWCVNEAKRERTEREKTRDVASRTTVPTPRRTNGADESYSPPPVSRKPAMYAADCDRLGFDREAHGIARDAPPMGTAQTHPAKTRTA